MQWSKFSWSWQEKLMVSMEILIRPGYRNQSCVVGRGDAHGVHREFKWMETIINAG